VEDRIGHQVDDDLSKPQRIDLHQREIRRLHLHPHTTSARLRFQRAHRVVNQERDVRGLLLQAHHTALGVCERPEIFDQTREHPRLLEHLANLLIVSRIHAVEHALEASLDHGQRRPQLMGDVGQQVPALTVLLLEPCRHPVERSRDDSKKWRAALDDACAVVAAGDAIGSRDDVPERQPDAAHRQGEEHQDDREHGEDGEECRRRAEIPRVEAGAPQNQVHERAGAGGAERQQQQQNDGETPDKSRTPRPSPLWTMPINIRRPCHSNAITALSRPHDSAAL
jgi:hypothetical protein